MKTVKIFSILLIVISLAVSFWALPKMPDRIASHWGIDGLANGYSSKNFGLFLMPVVSVFMLLLFWFLPAIDPLKENIKKFQKEYNGFIFFMMLFLSVLHVSTIVWNLGYRFNMSLVVPPLIGVLMIYCGYLLVKSKRNWFIGIRTPWTLSNDAVWEKTNTLGGKLFIASGLISFLSFFCPSFAFLFLLVPIIFSSVFSLVYSYVIWKKIK